MKITVKRIHPESFALAAGTICLLLSLTGALVRLLLGDNPKEPATASSLFTPLLAGAIGAVNGYLIAIGYNIYAKHFRGITIETDDSPDQA